MKVLIAMSDTGAGHRSVSNAVAEALKIRFDARVAIVDLLKLDESSFGYKFSRLYGPVIRWRPEIYGAVWHLTDHPAFYRMLSGSGGASLVPRTRRLFQQYQPDLIVSAHSLCNRLIFQALEGIPRIPVVATVTELVMVHASWVEPGIERYTAATPEVVANTIAKGAPADRIVLTGLPASRRFGNVTSPREDLRRAFGLDPEKFTVLAIGGGEGAGALGEMMEHLWKSHLDLQTVVIAGRAEALKRRLEALAPPGHVVLGFTKIMPELMHLADVVVTKGGPQTIVEALCARRPLIITQCLPGQEQENDDFVQTHGVGYAAQTPDRLVLYLEELMKDPAKRARMAEAAADVARPGAADAVAAVCGKVLGIPASA